MTLILALDIATKTGWARGRPMETPKCGSIRFGGGHSAIYAECFEWLTMSLQQHRPDVVVIEDLLPVFAKQGSTNRATGHLLGGLHGVVKLAVHQRRLPIEVVSVVDV